jgi:NADH:ubiquinone oxidoreductase subunit 5 (subunit L)/multisubunit Na+/H+ antiporter MnhA subunit
VLLLCAFSFTALYSFRALFRVFHGKAPAGKTPKESPPAMLVPILVLAVSVLVAWAILQAQPLLSSTNWIPEASTLGASLAVLGLFGAAAYYFFLSNYQRTAGIVAASPSLRGVRSFLHDGLWFDRLYNAAVSGIVGSLSAAAARIQTGLLRVNMGLILLAAVAFFFLFAIGVL